MSTPHSSKDDAALAEWVQRQLATAPPLTQEQQRTLRRLLLPAQPLKAPAKSA